MQRNLFKESKKYIPGGVNSPVRAFKDVGGNPIFVNGAKGSRLYGVLGGEFVDFCMSYGALILGHSHPEVVEALKDAVEKGTSYGAPTESETELAKFITESMPSIELVRLTNSGAEAVITAVRLAKAFTKREKIIKFKGCYHGFILDDYVEDLERYIEQAAAVIIEPVGANNGVVVRKKSFLEKIRKLCTENGALLIFDEVVTGFRLGLNGAQGIFGIKPDLTCLGKIIGGGLPIGAFGGRRDIMELLVPIGNVYHAGTFSGNPVSVAAGLATLKILKRDKPYKRLEEMAKRLGVDYFGSMFSFKSAFAHATADEKAPKDFKRFYHAMLKKGIYLSPSISETNFISTAHTEEEIGRLYEAVYKWETRRD